MAVTLRAALSGLPLACPLDGLALTQSEHGLGCIRGHNYNLSRRGYLNLLPAKLKPSRSPGDSAAMIDARREVLSQGVFKPCAALLERLVCEQARHLAAAADVDHPLLVVDAGCGEGYYTDRLRRALLADDVLDRVAVLGADISTPAITTAARQYPDTGWVIANNKRLPVVQGRADVLVCVFGFETWAAWASLQREGQRVVTLRAGPRHLYELRERIYPEVRLHAVADDSDASAAGYERIDEQPLHVHRSLDDPALAMQLLTMTPHAHRLQGGAADTLDLSRLSAISLDVVARTYRRV